MRQKKSSSRSATAKLAAKAVAKPAVKARAKPVAAQASAKPSQQRKPAKVVARAKVAPAVKAKTAVTKQVVAKTTARKPAAPLPVRSVYGRANPEAPPSAPPKKAAGSKRSGRAIRQAKFAVGQVVRHRVYPFRGVVFDIDPVFANTEEWLAAIPPDVRPRRNQPFYHLLAESEETEYIAYVSEQNLLPDETGQPLRHPQISEYFVENDDGTLRAVFLQAH